MIRSDSIDLTNRTDESGMRERVGLNETDAP